MSVARIFKIESFGATDGPGVRLVVFFQGCCFRCKYCHNPESWEWDRQDQPVYSVGDIIKMYNKNKPYYVNGGITVSGGEPMLQSEFVLKLAKVCKRKHIRLAIDTSAANVFKIEKKYRKIAKYTDLWIVDIKATIPEEHENITGSKLLTGMKLISLLEQLHKPYWLRYVLVKNLTDSKEQLQRLGKFISTLKYCKNYELLPYHSLATNKYKKLGINYPLSKVKIMDSKENNECLEYLLKIVNSNLNKKNT